LEFGDLLRQTKYAKRVSGPNRGLSGRIDESFSIQTIDGDDCYAEAFTHMRLGETLAAVFYVRRNLVFTVFRRGSV